MELVAELMIEDDSCQEYTDECYCTDADERILGAVRSDTGNGSNETTETKRNKDPPCLQLIAK